MSNQSLKSKVAKGAVWTLMEKLSTQVVGFVVSMVLARLLTPDDYGTVALTAIFFGVAGVLVDGGFGGALVQKKDVDDLDYNSVFYLNVAMSLLMYAIMYVAAPFIADFYSTPILKSVVRISAFSFIFDAVNAVQNAELVRKMQFHLSFRISLITCISSAVCGLTLAFMGYGVWAIVWSSLITGFVGMVARWFIIAWRPRWMFSLSRLGPLFSYGWKMTVSTIVSSIFTHINSILIGKFYRRSDIAFVDKGNAIPSLLTSMINETIGRVSFPALATMQNDRAKLRELMRRMIRGSTFFVFPFMVWLCIGADSLIRLLYGEKWLSAVPYLRLACFTFILWPFHTINLNGIKALGRSDVFLKLEIIKRVLSAIVILVSFRLGVFTWMAISAFVIGPLAVIINAWPNKRLLGYSIKMQVKDVYPAALACLVEVAVMIGVLSVVNIVEVRMGVQGTLADVAFLVCKLMFLFIFGVGAYFVTALAFRFQVMSDYLEMLMPFIKERMPRLAKFLVRTLLVMN